MVVTGRGGGSPRRSRETGNAIVEPVLDTQKPASSAESSINGYGTDPASARSIAIQERSGLSGVAGSRDGPGEPMNANTWFYFHAERLGYCHQRRAYAATPLPAWMLEEIQRLQREEEARRGAAATQRRKVTLGEAAARLRRAFGDVFARFGGRSSRYTHFARRKRRNRSASIPIIRNTASG